MNTACFAAYFSRKTGKVAGIVWKDPPACGAWALSPEAVLGWFQKAVWGREASSRGGGPQDKSVLARVAAGPRADRPRVGLGP